MSETKFLIGRSGLDLQDDFYPDDLPHEWRFDYYYTMFRALSLPIDGEEDLESVFENLAEAEAEDEFELVISIEAQQLQTVEAVQKLLAPIAEHRSEFILFCELDQALDADVLTLLKDYRVCFQSGSALEMGADLQHRSVTTKELYYNDIPVLYSSDPWNEQQMRDYLEQAAEVNSITVLICKYAEAETLNKIRVISEILGFWTFSLRARWNKPGYWRN